MPKYQVRRGYTWGIERNPSGAVVELSEDEARGFEFKLERLTEEEAIRADELGKQLRGQYEETEAFRVNPVEEDGVEWADLPDSVIDILEDAGIEPEAIPSMEDEELRAIVGIGPAHLRKIREAYPKGV